MRIKNNITALNANRNLKKNTLKSGKDLEKLSSGYVVNRAADDSAGLSVSESLRCIISGTERAVDNCSNAISLVQTADAELQEVHDILRRMYELAVTSLDGIYSDSGERITIQTEFKQLQDEIDSISESASFNGKKLFSGNNVSATAMTAVNNLSAAPAATTLRATGTVVGSFTIIGGVENVDYTYSSGQLKIKTATAMTIRNTDPSVTTTDTILINSNANITLAGYNYSSTNGIGISVMNNSTLNLTIADGTANNISTTGAVAMRIAANCTVNIDGGGTLKLITTGNNYAAINLLANASLNISGGNITAFGGYHAAGIGGNSYGSCGNVTISGGEVNVTGGEGAAAIGGGFKGAGGNVTISGGKVNVTGGADGYGIGSGKNGSGSGTFTTTATGSADIKTNGTDIEDKSDQANWSGNIDNTVYGTAGSTGGSTSTGGTGTTDSGWTTQVGVYDNDTLDINIGEMNTQVLNISAATVNVSTVTAATYAAAATKSAIRTLSLQRSVLGSYQNRLEHKINSLQITHENLQAAESRIRDADMASFMSEYTKDNILIQSTNAVLAQTNNISQSVLSLLQ